MKNITIDATNSINMILSVILKIIDSDYFREQ